MSATVLCLAVAATLLWPGACARALWSGTGAPPSGRDADETARRRSAIPRGGPRRRSQARLQRDLADFVVLLTAPLRAGATPALALVTVARSMSPGPELRTVLAELVEAGSAASGLAPVWLSHAERLDSTDLRFVARAWQLTERTGAPLAEALVSVERVLRARQQARERVATAAAGPRSSMAVLVALPCAGPLVGLAFGISPVALYLSSPASLAAGVLGIVLGLLAWLWARRIIAGALRTRTASTGGVGDP